MPPACSLVLPFQGLAAIALLATRWLSAPRRHPVMPAAIKTRSASVRNQIIRFGPLHGMSVYAMNAAPREDWGVPTPDPRWRSSGYTIRGARSITPKGSDRTKRQTAKRRAEHTG